MKKLINIDNLFLVQEKQNLIVTILWFVFYITGFISFLYCIVHSLWFYTICSVLVSIFAMLRWLSRSTYYVIRSPKNGVYNLFAITTEDNLTAFYVGTHMEEAKSFAAINNIKVKNIEILTDEVEFLMYIIKDGIIFVKMKNQKI